MGVIGDRVSLVFWESYESDRSNPGRDMLLLSDSFEGDRPISTAAADEAPKGTWNDGVKDDNVCKVVAPCPNRSGPLIKEIRRPEESFPCKLGRFSDIAVERGLNRLTDFETRFQKREME